jgi:hypothetical protein
MSTIMLPMMGAMDDQPVASKGLALGDQPQAGVTPGKCSFCKTNDETTDEEMQKTHDMQMRLMAP